MILKTKKLASVGNLDSVDIDHLGRCQGKVAGARIEGGVAELAVGVGRRGCRGFGEGLR